MFGLGMGEVLLILVLALIFIGPKKLPDLAKNIGKGMRDFQRAKDGLLDQIRQSGEASNIPPEKKEEPAQTQSYEAVDAEFHPVDDESITENKKSNSSSEKLES